MINADVVSALSEGGQTVAVAESLTGGLVVAALVEGPGASVAVRGGVVAYATELKHRLLDVDGDLLARRGPVDPQVAAQMALGVRERLGADWGIATTGVAGPEPQDGVQPGRVYVAVAGPLADITPAPEVFAGSNGTPDLEPLPGGTIGTRVLELDLPGDRAQVRLAATEQAIGALLTALREVAAARGGTAVAAPEQPTAHGR